MVAIGSGGALLVGECKWGAVTQHHLERLRACAQWLADELGGVRKIHLALFTGRGEADDAVRSAAEAGEILLFTADDLFGD